MRICTYAIVTLIKILSTCYRSKQTNFAQCGVNTTNLFRKHGGNRARICLNRPRIQSPPSGSKFDPILYTHRTEFGRFAEKQIRLFVPAILFFVASTRSNSFRDYRFTRCVFICFRVYTHAGIFRLSYYFQKI